MNAYSTLLVVEDDPDVRDALELFLMDEGLSVASVAQGEEALEYLRAHPSPCAILLDLMMPVMDGYAFRRAQLADPRLTEIPTFVVTAGALDERVEQMRVRRAFTKPLDVQELLTALGAVCACPPT
jgi:CheY-like chemotaxis protein